MYSWPGTVHLGHKYNRTQEWLLGYMFPERPQPYAPLCRLMTCNSHEWVWTGLCKSLGHIKVILSCQCVITHCRYVITNYISSANDICRCLCVAIVRLFHYFEYVCVLYLNCKACSLCVYVRVCWRVCVCGVCACASVYTEDWRPKSEQSTSLKLWMEEVELSIL